MSENKALRGKLIQIEFCRENCNAIFCGNPTESCKAVLRDEIEQAESWPNVMANQIDKLYKEEMKSEPAQIKLPGVEMIAFERSRQILEEGWTAEHDDEHRDSELARVGALYALPSRFRFYTHAWPAEWSREWFKPTPDNRIRELVKAGALIAAEIDRIKRLTEENPHSDDGSDRSG